MDGCPLGLGLVVEDKPTEFSCSYSSLWLCVESARKVNNFLSQAMSSEYETLVCHTADLQLAVKMLVSLGAELVSAGLISV